MSRRDVASGTINLAMSSHYAAIYARVSAEDQGKGFSIPTQIEACQKLADREGYTVAGTSVLVVHLFSLLTKAGPGLLPSEQGGGMPRKIDHVEVTGQERTP